MNRPLRLGEERSGGFTPSTIIPLPKNGRGIIDLSNSNEILLLGLHVGVYVLYILVLLETLYDLIDGSTLLVGNILEVVGDAGELGTAYLETALLKVLLDL